ncbi:hypothetical protein HOLleu_05416 [Holothuria leucospilota]|uniref:Carboxylesterase type B domain-containing protein n=1 Tax=Holothuria leucospilota TaxID=206669 RepID=A0A9Q1CJX0_HOLLE|nr:hypothetical protein HOLleu_05416 [Holothuria leucospilota]
MAKDMNSSYVYHYYFDHALSFAEDIPMFHAEDLPFFFQSASAMGLEFTAKEKNLIDIYSAYLANFIHYGDPNTISDEVKPKLANLNLVRWNPIDSRHLHTMVFSTTETVECKIGIRQKQCDFLDDIGYYNVPNMNRK